MTTPVQAIDSATAPGHAWAVLNAERQDVCAAMNSGAEPLSERALRLSRIDFAMDRLMNGQYGRCLTCDGPVEQKLLATDPALSLCYACRTGIENEHTIA